MLLGSNLLATARRLADDQMAPYYVSDEEMYQYMNDAERTLAYHGRMLRDVLTYTVQAGDRWLEMGTDPEVIEFTRAELTVTASGNVYPLRLRGNMDGPWFEDGEAAERTERQVSTSASKPHTLYHGRRTGYIELSPVPVEACTIEASVVTYPPYPITTDGLTESSLPTQYHSLIPIGAALFALETGEIEVINPARIQALNISWDRAIGRTVAETARMTRDASTVQFSNDMW